MYSLILKDILIQKKMMGFTLAYCIFILIAFNSPVFASMTYVMGAMASSYLFIQGACAYESKGNSEIVLNSFPLRRSEIVGARYLSVFVFMFLSLVIIGFFGAVMKGIGLPFPQRYIGWIDVLGVAVTLLLMSSLYLPLYFKFGYIQARFFNVILFLLIFFTPSLVKQYYEENREKEIFQTLQLFLEKSPPWLIGCLITTVLLLLVYLSYLFSVRIYQHREF